MCGILGVVATTPVNQLLYDGLMVLQHRGQDAAGIVTGDGGAFHMHKAPGLVRDVFRTRNMRALPGNMGIAHCRYPTAGSPSDSSESQPVYVNSPFGLVLAHNGNLTNTRQLQEAMFRQDLRHINTRTRMKTTTQAATRRKAGSTILLRKARATSAPHHLAARNPSTQAVRAMISPTMPRQAPSNTEASRMVMTT